MIKINDLTLLDIAAKSTLEDNNTKYIYEAISYALSKKHNEYIKKFYLDLESLTDIELDYLLWESGVEYLNENISKESKIKLINKALQLHFNKGTIGSIKTICDILFNGAVVKEWFEYGGRPGYFKIFTESEIGNNFNHKKVLSVINEYKNVRSWIESISFYRKSDMNFYIGIACETQIVNTLNMRKS